MKFNFKKPKKKTVILLAVFLVIALGIGYLVIQSMKPQIAVVATTPLELQDLRNTVNVTGTVFSEDTTEVYAPLSGYNVKSVPVSVGDVVSVGDTLCELDVEPLRQKIEQSKAKLSDAQQEAYFALRGAQLALETEQFNLERNYDMEIMKAESAVKSAEMSVEQALESMGTANAGYRDMQRAYNDANMEEDETLRQLEQASISARQAYDKAKQGLEDAKATLRATQIAKREAEVQSKRAITKAEMGTSFTTDMMAIESDERDLEKAVVKAPVSGTITAVFAKEGAAGTGLLFVIEDTGKLLVNTKVKEYDIANVHSGQYVEIKADGAGDEAYDGEVTKIAPTTVKGTGGTTVSSSDAEFETEIKVVSMGTRLMIGMNARLAIMTEEKKDVLAVSYDAITTNANGDQVVFVARRQEAAAPDGERENEGIFAFVAGKQEAADPKYQGPELYTAHEFVVETGMETDYLVEIFASGLREGDLIIANPVDIADGTTIMLGQMGPEGALVPAGSGSGGIQMVVQ